MFPLHHLLNRLSQPVEVVQDLRRQNGDVLAVSHGHAPQQFVSGVDIEVALGFRLPAKGVGVPVGAGSVSDGVGTEPSAGSAEGPWSKGTPMKATSASSWSRSVHKGALKKLRGWAMIIGICRPSHLLVWLIASSFYLFGSSLETAIITVAMTTCYQLLRNPQALVLRRVR